MKIQNIINNILRSQTASTEEIICLLKSSQDEATILYNAADKLRADVMGDEVFFRGIIEFSNICRKNCNYCGIRAGNTETNRYRIPLNEIIESCKLMAKSHQTTVVLQSGEDPYYTKEIFGEMLQAIKRETGLAITVSVGERDEQTYSYWKEKGMDRYLLRFETSNEVLFNKCHPDDNFEKRVECLKILKKLDVQTGSGFLIGIPSETYEDLANDILYCTALDLDMIGIGPFISHPKTPFGEFHNPFQKDVYFKVISIIRLLNPKSHIPSTTAFDAIQSNGRNLLLQRGANVFMPNATPKKYRIDYQLYPGKPCVDESSEQCSACVINRIKSIGRKIGIGPGHSLKKS